jgi:cytochrome P450
VVTDTDFASMPATERAQWLPPSAWPKQSDELFIPRDFDTSGPLPVISRYDDVLTALHNRDDTWSRQVPLRVIPPEARHRTLDAAWGADGETHKFLRWTLRSINRGSTDQARAFTLAHTGALLARLLAEDPPWDLSRVIYEVSMATVIKHTLQAPPLWPSARRLRELTRDHVAAAGGFFGITRQLEAEAILADLIAQRSELPEGGLARTLVDLHLADPDRFTRDQLVGQLWLLSVSSETQATATASLVGMLLEFGEYVYAREVLDQPDPMRRLILEGGRRAIVFPASLLLATKPFTLDGQTVPVGTPCLASYAAANLDPSKFHDPLVFDPRAQRTTRHLAFGAGPHRCQGEVGAEQFMTDVVTALLQGLPADVRLHRGLVLRETGISMAVTRLPVTR